MIECTRYIPQNIKKRCRRAASLINDNNDSDTDSLSCEDFTLAYYSSSDEIDDDDNCRPLDYKIYERPTKQRAINHNNHMTDNNKMFQSNEEPREEQLFASDFYADEDESNNSNLLLHFEKTLQETLNAPTPIINIDNRCIVEEVHKSYCQNKDDVSSKTIHDGFLEFDDESLQQEDAFKDVVFADVSGIFNEYNLELNDNNNDGSNLDDICTDNTKKVKKEQEDLNSIIDKSEHEERSSSFSNTIDKRLDKLRKLMFKSQQTQIMLQEYDKTNGLPKNHCPTMIKTSRTRKQLKEGVIVTNSLLLK